MNKFVLIAGVAILSTLPIYNAQAGLLDFFFKSDTKVSSGESVDADQQNQGAQAEIEVNNDVSADQNLTNLDESRAELESRAQEARGDAEGRIQDLNNNTNGGVQASATTKVEMH